MTEKIDVLIIGGGAAGFFAAINTAERNPNLRVEILERGSEVLTKVKISGGGRCNVTHAEFSPKELASNYPRGHKELLGPFHTFMTGDTMEWFSQRGVELKIEEDGRIFPESDASQTIIDCFLEQAYKYNITVLKNHAVKGIKQIGEQWSVRTKERDFITKSIVIATGSNQKIWKILENLGHSIVKPVPSLFTFNCIDDRIKELPGISTRAHVSILDSNSKSIMESEGPLLITHWGMSGPAILRLSAWGAKLLNDFKYHFQIKINWLVDLGSEEAVDALKNKRKALNKKLVATYSQFEIPSRLWKSIVQASGISESCSWAETTNDELTRLSAELTSASYQIDGKSTFKEEFVTAGGIDLKEVNFKTFESKLCNRMYFAGEVLNIDAITGGFNFQNAWTGGFIVAKALTTEH